MCYTFRVDGKVVSPAQEIELSKIANISTAIVQCEMTFIQMMKSLLNYIRVFEECIGLHIVNLCML